MLETEKIVNDMLDSLYRKQEDLLGTDFTEYDRVHNLLKKISNRTCLRHRIGDILIDTRFVTDYGRFETLIDFKDLCDSLEYDQFSYETLTEAYTGHLQILASIINGTYTYQFKN